MYHFLIAVQVVTVMASMYSTIRLLKLRTSIDNKYLFACALCIDIYAIGYLDEMLCKTSEGIFAALSFEYVGLSYVALCYFLFTYNYCHFKWMPKFFKVILFAWCTFIMVLLQTARFHSIYYKTFDVSADGFFPHFVTTKTPLYYIFALYQYALLILCAISILKHKKTVKKPSEQRRLFLLTLESIIPVIGLSGTVFFDLQGWDPSPLILSFLVTSMTITLQKGHFFDVISLAKDDMFVRLNNAAIITGSTHNYIDSNRLAETIFPEISEMEQGYDLDSLEIDLFDTEKDVFFERGGRYYQSTCTGLWEKNANAGYIIFINDITDMRLQMEKMKELKEEADAANEAKSAFLANMSHEIRTPLNAIIGMAELSEKEKTESVIREYNGQIKAAGKMLLGIVTDVLDFSKAESGKLELVPVEFDTAEFLNAVINVVNMRIGDKPVDFLVDIDPTIPKTLYGDDVHIRQIIMNLLSNAEKFTQSGHIRFKLDGESEGHAYRLKGLVEDTGIGIKPEDKEKVFNAFQQLDSKKNRKIEGSGLGLAIFAQLVSLMQGTYSIESEYGKGSTFSFDILVEIVDNKPFAETEREEILVQKITAFSLYGTAKTVEADTVEAERKNEEEQDDYSAYSILVVDDNKVNLKVITAFLKHFKIEAETAMSGPEAIEKVKEKKYDLIFMDHMMPDMDGVQTTQIIRGLDIEHCTTVPIIACTANVVKGVEELFLQAGMDDFVPKPVQLDTLRNKLGKFLKK